MIKYALIRCLQWDGELQVAVHSDNYSDIKGVEAARSDYLKRYPKMNPQNFQVLQYDSKIF